MKTYLEFIKESNSSEVDKQIELISKYDSDFDVERYEIKDNRIIIFNSLWLRNLKVVDEDFLKNVTITGDLSLYSLEVVKDKDFLKSTTIGGELNLGFDIFNGYESREFLQETTHVGRLIVEASDYGNINAVKYLLKNPNVDPTIEDNNALKFAFGNKHWKVVELLLQDDRFRYSDNELYFKYKREIRRMYREGLLP